MWRWRCGDGGGNRAAEHIDGRLLQAAVRNSPVGVFVFCSKCRTCTILAHSQGPRWMRKPVSITVPVVVPASRSEGALHQGKAHWLDLPLQPLPPCIKRRAAYSVLLTERLYRLPTLLLTGNQLAPVLPSLRRPLLVAHATTMRPSTPCGLVVFIGCLLFGSKYVAGGTSRSDGSGSQGGGTYDFLGPTP